MTQDYDEAERGLEEVQRILAEKGITMQVGGCGCCGSPWMKFEYEGRVVFDYDSMGFNMFEEVRP